MATFESCPDGTVGVASRFCNETEGWRDPDLSNCTSLLFIDLKKQVTGTWNNVIHNLKQTYCMLIVLLQMVISMPFTFDQIRT